MRARPWRVPVAGVQERRSDRSRAPAAGMATYGWTDEVVVTLVCPSCAASTTVGSIAQAGSCPRCGRSLKAADRTPPHSTPVDADVPTEEAGCAEPLDEALIADLREALGSTASLPDRESLGRFTTLHRRGADLGGLLPPATLTPHTRLGDFEILGEIGRGGMGIVYRARQVSLGREVALKVLPGYECHGSPAVERFRTEAQAAARIHHTNVVPIYAQGEHNGHFYYAMELIDGVGLDTVIRSRPDLLSTTHLKTASANRLASSGTPGATATAAHGPRTADKPRGLGPATGAAGRSEASLIPADDDNQRATRHWTRADYQHIAGLLAEVAGALDCAHRQGVIHRDVKPHNLLLGTSDSDVRLTGAAPGQPSLTQRLHLTDFGLARLTDAPHLTVSGEVLGTPAYLSPEQVRGRPTEIDHRTDVYSLGVTLYEVLTGCKPFDGETRDEVIARISTADPIAPRRLDSRIPIDLETICLRAIERDPARRHPTAALLAEDLRRFADGRPILSRRTSRLVKAGKWVRRHKAGAVALAAAAMVAVLAGGWTWSAAAGRHREAGRLLTAAYAQLAYNDFRQPQLVQADIARAAELGADPVQLDLVGALAAMGENKPAEALENLTRVLAHDAGDLRAWYLLSWAHWRNRDPSAAREAFAHAEQLRATEASDQPAQLSADAWFFRGLATHFVEPLVAIQSYRTANALRARNHGFYPQAILHLARAQNQQLYSMRSLDALPEALASLQQLVDQGYYEAFPYYLLSITHRLAAEIYTGSEGTRGDQLVAEHYAQALDWARRGQQVSTTDDRPISAEAECLESMGLYAEAIEARTRAIAVAAAGIRRCEGYHYRWRLHYWTGDLDAALADVTAHAACDPNSPLYAHVYPALIRAERGDWQSALAHARALADGQPPSAMSVVWSATCLRLLGRSDEAVELLAASASIADYGADLMPPQTEDWVRALYAFCQDPAATELPTLVELADGAPTPWKLWGEAHFHAGVARLAAGDRPGALEMFRTAYRSFDGEERYTFHAKLIYVRMQKDLAWPPWLPVSWDSVPGGRADSAVTESPPPAGAERRSP